MSNNEENNQEGWINKPNVEIDVADIPRRSNLPKINLKAADFDQTVLNQGVRVKVFRTAFCPNVKSIDGAEHEINCQVCGGGGFIDRLPTCSWAHLHGQGLTKNAAPEGLIEENTVGATFLQGVSLQYFTLVELLDFTESFYQRIKRQDGNLDVLRYPGTQVNMVLDKNGKNYVEGIHFCLNKNGNIKWKANKGPVAGTIYTIHYETNIRYRAIKANHSNRFAQITEKGKAIMVKMNEAWTLEKEYLANRIDEEGQPIPPNKIRDPDED